MLRRVEAGETIEVTDRGRPVAVLAPLPDEGGLARLRRAGQTDGPDATFGELPEPLMPAEGARLPSEVLAELRRGER